MKFKSSSQQLMIILIHDCWASISGCQREQTSWHVCLLSYSPSKHHPVLLSTKLDKFCFNIRLILWRQTGADWRRTDQSWVRATDRWVVGWWINFFLLHSTFSNLSALPAIWPEVHCNSLGLDQINPVSNFSKTIPSQPKPGSWSTPSGFDFGCPIFTFASHPCVDLVGDSI